MSATATHRTLLAELVRERPDLYHVCCCNNEATALCGLDVSDLPFTDGTGEQYCVVCDDLEDQTLESLICPLTGRACP